jgi:hypothetical protein
VSALLITYDVDDPGQAGHKLYLRSTASIRVEGVAP